MKKEHEKWTLYRMSASYTVCATMVRKKEDEVVWKKRRGIERKRSHAHSILSSTFIITSPHKGNWVKTTVQKLRSRNLFSYCFGEVF